MADRVTFRCDKGRVFATITQDTAQQRTVQIGDYAKIITEKTQTIDITNYQQWEYDDWTMNGARYEGDAATRPSVVLDDTTYAMDVVWLPNAPALYTGTAMRWGWLSDLPYLLISPNMMFGFAFGNVEVNGSIEFDPETTITNDGDTPDALSYFADWQWGDATTFDIQPSFAGTVHIPTRVRPLGLNGVRLAWVNKYGAIDMWNFDYLRERTLAVETSRIYTGAGYTRLGTTAETTYTVETRELPQDLLATLSYITVSPAVWIVRTASDAPTEIDVLTEECRIFSDKELSTLQIEYRTKEREI